MNTEAIKTQGLQVGLVTAGFMGANLVTKVAPIKNDKVKSLLPLALGLAAAMASKNKNIQVVGVGAASFGLLKTVRTLLAGSDPMGTDGIRGIADNPAVKKVLNMLIPNLGEIDEYGNTNSSYASNYFEPAIVDVPFEDVSNMNEVNGIGSLEENALLGPIEEDSLLGFDLDYQNEMYL